MQNVISLFGSHAEACKALLTSTNKFYSADGDGEWGGEEGQEGQDGEGGGGHDNALVSSLKS